MGPETSLHFIAWVAALIIYVEIGARMVRACLPRVARTVRFPVRVFLAVTWPLALAYGAAMVVFKK